MISLLKPFIDQTITITCDNGKEFTDHERIAEVLQSRVYFAYPNAAWERGTNENTNGLLRQYFPRKCCFTDISQEKINLVIERLNNRPQKCLDFNTPPMVFSQSIN